MKIFQWLLFQKSTPSYRFLVIIQFDQIKGIFSWNHFHKNFVTHRGPSIRDWCWFLRLRPSTPWIYSATKVESYFLTSKSVEKSLKIGWQFVDWASWHPLQKLIPLLKCTFARKKVKKLDFVLKNIVSNKKLIKSEQMKYR